MDELELLHNYLLDTQEEVNAILEEYLYDGLTKTQIKEKYADLLAKRKSARDRIRELEQNG